MFFLISFVFATKVVISPYANNNMALSYTRKGAHSAIFEFVGKTRGNQSKMYCINPLVVPLDNGKHSFYFCKELMCLKENLVTCSEPSRDTEFLITEFTDDKNEKVYMVGKDKDCLHVFQNNIFLKECNKNNTNQWFKIVKVKVPTGDNMDVSILNRREGQGNSRLLKDQAYRDLSDIENAQFISKLYKDMTPKDFEFGDNDE